MNREVLDNQVHKVIEKIGLGNAFMELCNYISPEELSEWLDVIEDEYNINLYD